MDAASLADLKTLLKEKGKDDLIKICLRLARFKKENKELLTYLLLESEDEPGFISSIKAEMEDQFSVLKADRNVYFIKKSVRKILRGVNRYCRYSGHVRTELELRLFFCLQMRQAGVPIEKGTVLGNLYGQQEKRVNALLAGLPEDLRGDYVTDLEQLS